MDCRDVEAAAGELVLLDYLESLEYLPDSSVRQMINCRETNL
jgi:hypothetical protein